MKANPYNVAKVFSNGGAVHYVLPYFQRQYSWEEKNWDDFLEDIFETYTKFNRNVKTEHFLGSIVVIPDGTVSGNISCLKLVDGQQRLTTISLLLCVLRDLAKAKNQDKLARKINKFLINEDEEGDALLKLVPTEKYGDQLAYKSLLNSQAMDQSLESLIPNAYEHLYEYIGEKIDNHDQDFCDGENFDLGTIFTVITSAFHVIFIELSRDESPYKIFESLNAKGVDLTQADLVRNYIAMRLPNNSQKEVFENLWQPIENQLQEKRAVGQSRIGELTAFLRHYLAMWSGTLCREESIYEHFRERCEQLNDDGFVEELERLKKFSSYYNNLLRPDQDKSDKDIFQSLQRLSRLEFSTAYPFLLSAYDAMSQSQISTDQFLVILQILENYLVRRFIVGEPSNYQTTMFPILWRDIERRVHEGNSLENSLKNSLVERKYPDDNKVVESIRTRSIYKSSYRERICLVLESINRYLSSGTDGFTVLEDKPSIEHILPQNPSREWKEELGLEFDETHSQYLHTLGNLTLVTGRWNIEQSNLPFEFKKLPLADHALKLNSNYFSRSIEKWDAAAINERAHFLSQAFLKIWPSLGTPTTTIKEFHGKPKSIVIRGEIINIPRKTWRQALIQVSEWIITQYPEVFEKVKNSSSFIVNNLDNNTDPKSWSKLSNGSWIYNKNSARRCLEICRRFLETAGLRDSDWAIEESD